MKECHGRKSLTMWPNTINADIQGVIYKKSSQNPNYEKAIATNMAVLLLYFESAVLGDSCRFEEGANMAHQSRCGA